jgi:metal-responsive CopG/Arc/MetJ family transcriptional regulator
MAAKVLVSFPEAFLAEVDRIAAEEHRSRSELLREAMRLYIEIRRGRRRAGGGGGPGRLIPPGPRQRRG